MDDLGALTTILNGLVINWNDCQARVLVQVKNYFKFPVEDRRFSKTILIVSAINFMISINFLKKTIQYPFSQSRLDLSPNYLTESVKDKNRSDLRK